MTMTPGITKAGAGIDGIAWLGDEGSLLDGGEGVRERTIAGDIASGVGDIVSRAEQGSGFEMLEALSTGQEVVGDVQDVVALVVRQVPLEQVEVPVDALDQSQLPGQEMDGPDAATGNSAGLVRHLVVNVAGSELWSEGEGIILLVEPALDSALDLAEPAVENDLHLKSFRVRGAWWSGN